MGERAGPVRSAPGGRVSVAWDVSSAAAWRRRRAQKSEIEQPGSWSGAHWPHVKAHAQISDGPFWSPENQGQLSKHVPAGPPPPRMASPGVGF